MRTVNSFVHASCQCGRVIVIIFQMSQLRSSSARMSPERHENDKKARLKGRKKKTNLVRLKSVQWNECGHTMLGRGPDNNDPLPDDKQHLELAEHQQTLREGKLIFGLGLGCALGGILPCFKFA